MDLMERRAAVDVAPRFLHDFLLAAGRADLGRTAVLEPASGEMGGLRSVSYAELEARAQRYADQLADAGLDIGDRVLLESDNGADAVAAVLACSMAGVAFVPVSPETPVDRLLAVAQAARPALCLQPSAGKCRDVLPAEIGLARFDRDGLTVVRPPVRRARRRRAAATTDPAYVIFTSGTTGRPKGVVMSHRGVLAFYRGMLHERIVTAEDRVATTSPLQFDFALLDIGLALGSGATLITVPRSTVPWPRRLLGLLAETGATQVNGVPSIWRPALRHEPELLASLTRLRGILFSGEAFPIPEVRRLQELLPKVRLVNCFGPTEAMAFSLTDVPNPLPPDQERLSIGHAYAGAEMMLVDEHGAVVDGTGERGEIHMRGPSLFTGYWGDPDGTARALVPDPLNPDSGQLVYRSGDVAYRGEDGGLYFCGRLDSQVKIHGNRVELGEVERRVAEFPGVAQAAALLVPHGVADAVLGVCVVLEPGSEPLAESSLAGFCKRVLPQYMVPRRIRTVERFPVTANGKTDRRALLEHLIG